MRVPADRATVPFVDKSREPFRLKGLPATKQFADMYFTRLGELRPSVERAVQRTWGAESLKQCVKTLDAEPDVPVLVIGTVYKEMKRKPNILEEVTRDVLDVRPADDGHHKYCGDDDVLFLEDESGRLVLIGEALATVRVVTGVVIAVRGKVKPSGELQVSDLCFAGIAPQPPLSAAATSDCYVALVSGLHVGDPSKDMLPLQMLLEHLTGQLGCAEDHQQQANIVRLIIAGNATSNPVDSSAETGSLVALDVMKKLATAEQQKLSRNVYSLDRYLTSLTSSMPVDLMPGETDPSNFLLPQQPFHHCMLPQSSELETLNLCTNPYACNVGGVDFLGSSGQPLDDMMRYLPSEDRLQALVDSLHFQHIAPTAPDTLGCYPFTSSDPFIMKECPHVYFAGNQPRFESQLVNGPEGQRVLAVLVPAFEQERTCVLVNLRTLECEALSFAGLDEQGE
ncbi:hypothetical protein AB1Y20_001559 [Prymnesium parvum]|uniref:DNA polymerase delta subunit 2 n=1 Tax=Prymnesium parvum TaxID=97485 RepID=A0AB34K9V8_PRYPA